MMQFSSDRYPLLTRAVVLILLIVVPGISANAATLNLVPEEGNYSGYAPHHTKVGNLGHPSEGSDPTHYFAETGDAHHFSWTDQDLDTNVIDIYYDFRAVGGFANLISVPQATITMQALDLWSSVTNLNFVQNTIANASEIINIGTGDLAAFGFVSGVGATLGLGGGTFTHNNLTDTHLIGSGIVWMDMDETWDVVLGNGNPGGTFDYFTVVVQEIGHALGLGHLDDLGGINLLNGFYSVEQTALSTNDIEHITSIYGNASVIPIPPAVLLFGSGMLVLLGLRRRGYT